MNTSRTHRSEESERYAGRRDVDVLRAGNCWIRLLGFCAVVIKPLRLLRKRRGVGLLYAFSFCCRITCDYTITCLVHHCPSPHSGTIFALLRSCHSPNQFPVL